MKESKIVMEYGSDTNVTYLYLYFPQVSVPFEVAIASMLGK